MPKRLILFAVFIILYTVTHAQYAGWMTGTWESRSATTTSSGSITNTIYINDISGESFTGTKTTETNNGKIAISISGGFRGKGMYLQDGAVVQKEGSQNAQLHDCSACAQEAKMIIGHDSLVLISSISDCGNGCDGETIYYKLLSEYDDRSQRYLVDRFGRPSDIIGFRPYKPKEGDTVIAFNYNEPPVQQNAVATAVTTDPDARPIKKEEKKPQALPGKPAKVKQQQAADSIPVARKRQQQITDSLNLAQQKEQRHLKDSLDNVARLEKKRLKTQDSLRNVQAKKRQQEMTDSLNLAQQNKKQRIKDSLDDIARTRQQQINDSTLLAQQKKRQKQVADSLNLIQQKEQQRIKDSLKNVAMLEKIRLRTEDSLRDAQAKKRQQEVADSLSLANEREQQHIKDSLQNVAAANVQKQRTADSLSDVQARKTTDSLAAVRKQQYNDSLQKAALAKAVKPITNSNQTAANKELTSRTSVLLNTYHISSPDILIELFDNGEIDGDRVSVYHNNAIVVSNQVLGTKPITLNVHADTSNREHEFVLVAENLGSIPPNSALMRVTAGKQTYKLSVNTDMKTNARIVFIYDGN